jgi:hypothetical protein
MRRMQLDECGDCLRVGCNHRFALDLSCLSALQFRVRDRAALTAALTAGEIASSARMGSIVVAPETAMGATLVFD